MAHVAKPGTPISPFGLHLKRGGKKPHTGSVQAPGHPSTSHGRYVVSPAWQGTPEGLRDGSTTGTFFRPREAGRACQDCCLIWEGCKGVGSPVWSWEHTVGAFGVFTRSRICHTIGTAPNHPHALLSRVCNCQS